MFDNRKCTDSDSTEVKVLLHFTLEEIFGDQEFLFRDKLQTDKSSIKDTFHNSNTVGSTETDWSLDKVSGLNASQPGISRGRIPEDLQSPQVWALQLLAVPKRIVHDVFPAQNDSSSDISHKIISRFELRNTQYGVAAIYSHERQAFPKFASSTIALGEAKHSNASYFLGSLDDQSTRLFYNRICLELLSHTASV